MRTPSRLTLACLLLLLAFAGQARASGITNSSEDLRTGWYPGESELSPELIEGGTVGEEFSTKVEGRSTRSRCCTTEPCSSLPRRTTSTA